MAFVRVDESELAAMPNIKLYPGMPATVMIPTVQRTAFDYIVGPLVNVVQSFIPAKMKRSTIDLMVRNLWGAKSPQSLHRTYIMSIDIDEPR